MALIKEIIQLKISPGKKNDQAEYVNIKNCTYDNNESNTK